MTTPGLNDSLLPDVNECLDGSHLCAQTCVNTEGSYVCSCGTGYRLNNDGLNCSGTVGSTIMLKGHCDHDSVNAILYTDMNECQEGLHSCAQICINILGSYTCRCREGFMLSTDLRACEGQY